MKRVTVIDGQGGRIGKLIVSEIVKNNLDIELLVVGTNSIATSEMLKGGAPNGATGENPVIVASENSDIIIGPIGIISANSLFGEITPNMAIAVGKSRAIKLLLPVSHCNNEVVGVKKLSINEIIKLTVERLKELV